MEKLDLRCAASGGAIARTPQPGGSSAEKPLG